MSTTSLKTREIGKDIDTLRESIRNTLLEEFDKEIAGQKEAKLAIIDTFLIGLFSLHRESCMGAIFLGGPTGVGKTQLVKVFAKILFGDSDGYTLIPGGKLKHPSDVSLFSGAEPGFIGYGDTPLLADTRVYAPYKKALKENKIHPLLKELYAAINISLVLVDETEKMHPQVSDALLSAMTDGVIHMSAGRETSSKTNPISYSLTTKLDNTIFIFTSNIGEAEISDGKRRTIGFTESVKDTSGDNTVFESRLKERFAPEFLGRMNHIIRCENASLEMIHGVIQIYKGKINKALSAYYEGRLNIDFTAHMASHVANNLQAVVLESGLRPVVRMMEQVGDKVGFAIHHADTIFGHGFAGGNILFDMRPDASLSVRLVDAQNNLEKIGINTGGDNDTLIDTIIEKRVYAHRASVDTYIRLLLNYTPEFGDALIDLEKRLRDKSGFSEEDLKLIRMKGFMDYHKNAEKPSSSIEQLSPDIGMFEGVAIKALKKMIQGLIKQKVNLAVIYGYIEGFMERPILEGELRFVSWYIQQQEMLRNSRIS